MNDMPDRELDPPDYGFYIECRDCGCDVRHDEHLAGRCKPCFQKRVREENRRELNKTLTSIARGI